MCEKSLGNGCGQRNRKYPFPGILRVVDGEFRRVCDSTIRIFTLTPAELGWRNGVLVGNGPTVIVYNVPDSGRSPGQSGS